MAADVIDPHQDDGVFRRRERVLGLSSKTTYSEVYIPTRLLRADAGLGRPALFRSAHDVVSGVNPHGRPHAGDVVPLGRCDAAKGC